MLAHTDNLAQSLQDPKLSAAEGEKTVKKTIETLQLIRDDSSWDLLWKKVKKSAEERNIFMKVIINKTKNNIVFNLLLLQCYIHRRKEHKNVTGNTSMVKQRIWFKLVRKSTGYYTEKHLTT